MDCLLLLARLISLCNTIADATCATTYYFYAFIAIRYRLNLIEVKTSKLNFLTFNFFLCNLLGQKIITYPQT